MQNNPKRKRKGCIIAVVSLLILLVGCGQQEPAEPTINIFYYAEDGTEEEITYTYEVTKPEEMDLKKDKTILTFAASSVMGQDSPFINSVNAFNQENEKYYVELTSYHWGDELQEARTRIAMEIGSGGGPDILHEDVFPVNQGILDNGVLVNLTPYLEQSRITSETYFPGYASIVSDGKIYGLTTDSQIIMYAVDVKVLGEHEIPDFDSFLDKLLKYPEKAGFMNEYQTPARILMRLLQGSETLWGTIDWKKGTCDFKAPIFSKMIDVAKRYGEDNQAGYEPVIAFFPVYYIDIGQGKLEDLNQVFMGTYFDDGCYPMYQNGYSSLMINANTEHLEGAYAFLSYVMTKGQKYYSSPMRKATWEKRFQYEKSLAEAGRVFPPMELTDERKQLALELLETGRFAPRRTEAILDIVNEEIDAYFKGTKSKEAVLDLIQNRVQLYLDEL